MEWRLVGVAPRAAGGPDPLFVLFLLRRMIMAKYYSGEPASTWKTEWLDEVDFLHDSAAVGLTGDGANVFGHCALRVGDYYFHVDEPGFTYPKWLTRLNFVHRYLR